MRSIFIILLSLLSINTQGEEILAGLDLLKSMNLEIISSHQQLGVGLAQVNFEEKEALAHKAHDFGRCGGFESVTGEEAHHIYSRLLKQEEQNQFYQQASLIPYPYINKKPKITAAIKDLDKNKIKESIQFLSSFHTRYHRSNSPNEHVYQFQERLEEMLSTSSLNYDVALVDHKGTDQKSLRVRILGTTYPAEVVILGGHLDSIVQSFFGSPGAAPGADDNASGSANLFETLRVLSQQSEPQRTIEFYWYAGEEGGLIGSSEIAQLYKESNVDVVSVLQLDMTTFPGNGEFIFTSITDFTHAKLRDFLAEINQHYVGGTIVESKCGYGCSDHASWHRQGFPAVFPAESEFSKSNKKIHTSQDVIGPHMSFDHSLMFSKIALSYAMELANSRMRF